MTSIVWPCFGAQDAPKLLQRPPTLSFVPVFYGTADPYQILLTRPVLSPTFEFQTVANWVP